MLFIDCREGLSGDMLLAALLGLLPKVRRDEIAGLMHVAAEKRGMVFRVLDLAEGDDSGLGVSYSANDQAMGETSFEEAFSAIDRLSEELASSSTLPRKIIGMIFDAEAEAHGLPAREVHLHEIGRPQALLNVAGIGLAHYELVAAGIGEVVASTVTTGKGIVVVSHGAVRVPAPAAKILLRGVRHISGEDPGERATPSGIAAVKAMISRQSDDQPGQFRAKSIGFGTKRFGGRLGRTTVFRT